MGKSLEVLFSMFSTGAGIELLPVLEKNVEPKWIALIIITLCSAMLFVFMRFMFLSLPMKSSRFRRQIDSRFRIEGNWFQRVDETPDHPYSFAWIAYNPTTQRFSYNGRNFTKDLDVYARWQSHAVIVDERNERVQFLFDADLVKGAETIRGHGVIEFARPINNMYTTASGSFVDSGVTLKRRTFTSERVDEPFIKSVLSTTTIKCDDDIRKILRIYLRGKQFVSE